MFIDVTRYGGLRVQRLAVAAIAYLDMVEGGCAIHLIGGETLRVNEDVAEVEARATPPALIDVEWVAALSAPPAPLSTPEPDETPAPSAGVRSGGRGRTRQ